MKKYRLINNDKIENVLIAFLIFITIYFGRDTLVSTAWLNFSFTQIFIYFILLVYTIIFIWTNKKLLTEIIKDNRVVFFVIMAILFLLCMIVKKDYTLMYISCIIAIYFSIFLSFITDIKKFFLYYIYIICFFSIISFLISQVFRQFIFNNVSLYPIIKNTQGLEFINCFFTFLVNDPNYIRNFCIFREPGVFQYFLIIAIILENTFIKRKNTYVKILINVILIVGSISTFSTSAFIQLIIVLIAILIKNYKVLTKSKYKHYFILCAVIFFTITVYYIYANEAVYWAVWSMITKLFNANESLLSRLLSIQTNFYYFITNPLFGGKISNVLYAINNTNSSLILFSCYGIFIGTILNLLWFKIFRIKGCEIRIIIHNILLLFAILISLNSQNLTTNFYFYVIPILIYFETNPKNQINSKFTFGLLSNSNRFKN